MVNTPENPDPYEDVFFGTDVNHMAIQALMDFRLHNPVPDELGPIQPVENQPAKKVSDADLDAAFE